MKKVSTMLSMVIQNLLDYVIKWLDCVQNLSLKYLLRNSLTVVNSVASSGKERAEWTNYETGKKI